MRPKPAEGRAQARTCDPARSRTHDRAAPTRCAVVMPPNAAIILSLLLLVKRSFYFSAPNDVARSRCGDPCACNSHACVDANTGFE